MTLRLDAVTKSYGGKTILDGVNLESVPGTRLGLTGPNGSGKSTLLRMIAGLDLPDSGNIAVSGRPVLLEQQPQLRGGSVLDAVRPAELQEAEQHLRTTEERLTNPTAANLEAYARAEELYRDLGGYDHATRAETVLAGLGLEARRNSHGLSGGERRRLQLARLLLTPADLLLLDEPTNHLDQQGITWLENWLATLRATLLIVSHDRDFLDSTTDTTAVLERGRLGVWPGAWTEAMNVRAAEHAARERRRAAQLRRRRDLELEAGRLSSGARSAGTFSKRRAGNQALILAKAKAENVSRTLARRAQALQRRAEALDVPEAAADGPGLARIPMPEVDSGPGEVLRLENLTLRQGSRILVHGLDLLLRRGEKLAITGPNGSGKTTLLDVVTGRQAAMSGSVGHGHGLTIFTMSQDGHELDEAGDLGEALRTVRPGLRRQDIHHLLARLGLPPEPETPVTTLSGGERSRLALARLSVTRATLLVLDEPTNNLDVTMIEALESLLASYPGAVLFTTHDRRLQREVADRTLDISAAGLHSRSAGSSSPR